MEKRIVLLVVNLLFSELLENGMSDLVVHLHISDLVFWTIGEVSLPKLSLSYSQKKSTDCNSKVW